MFDMKKIVVYLIAIIAGVAIAIVIFFIILVLASVIITQASQFTTSSDLLSYTAVLISISGLFLTMIWNLIEHRRTSDIYKPVASVDVKFFPPYTNKKQETIFYITNKGQKNLFPEKITVMCDWLEDEIKIDIDRFDKCIAPEETIDLSLKLPEPKWPGTNTVTIIIHDKSSGISWKKIRKFHMSEDEVLKTGKSSPI